MKTDKKNTVSFDTDAIAAELLAKIEDFSDSIVVFHLQRTAESLKGDCKSGYPHRTQILLCQDVP